MNASKVLNPTRQAVLNALEVANQALNRAVTIEEVIEALAPDERKLLESSYNFALPNAIGTVLELLTSPVRGLVHSPGLTNNRRRVFASLRVIKPEEATVPPSGTQCELV